MLHAGFQCPSSCEVVNSFCTANRFTDPLRSNWHNQTMQMSLMYMTVTTQCSKQLLLTSLLRKSEAHYVYCILRVWRWCPWCIWPLFGQPDPPRYCKEEPFWREVAGLYAHGMYNPLCRYLRIWPPSIPVIYLPSYTVVHGICIHNLPNSQVCTQCTHI